MDSKYWNDRYLQEQTGWDMGMVSPPLKAYVDQLSDKELRILIPGGGNSYEAEYLWNQGFKHITVLDIAPIVIERLRSRLMGTAIQLLEGDFFQHKGQYDIILEQTFFCALEPVMRPDYARHMLTLLAPGGHLAGVMFDRVFERPGPPFGGTEEEYRALFSPNYQIKTLAPCYNSHPARQGSEVFINFIPK